MIVTSIKWQAVSCMIFYVFLSISAKASVNLTPDMAASVPPANDPNPPAANHAPDDVAIQIAAKSTLSPAAEGVFVSVHQGVVFLRGVVSKERDYLENVSSIYTAHGVKDVDTTNLYVRYLHHKPEDLKLTAKVIGTLMLMNVIGKDSADWPIEIKIKNGQVFVSGKLKSAAEKENVLTVIRCIQGIGTVSDRIQIKS